LQIKTGELLARIEAHLQPEDTVVGQVITVLGSKGGVGTTTVAVNLIMALRKAAQKKILLLDWQRPLGDVAFLLGLPETHDLALYPRHQSGRRQVCQGDERVFARRVDNPRRNQPQRGQANG
jgi:Mrp family chromosome partitioning ATPase